MKSINFSSTPSALPAVSVTEWERVAVEDSPGTGLPNRFGRVVVTAP